MVAQNDSVLSEAVFQKWPLDANSGKESELNNLLGTLTKNQKNHRDLKCEGCRPKDSFCNCSLDEIRHENTFKIFMVVESKKNFGTHFCPQLSVSSDFLFCDKEKTKWIKTKWMCDGVVHCPFTKIDESDYVCSPWHLKLIAIGIVLCVYAFALGVAIYLVFSRSKTEGLTEATKTKIQKVLGLVKKAVQDPTATNEENMRKGIKKMSHRNQLTLIRACHSIEVKGPKVWKPLFKPAVQRMFSTEAQRAALYGFVKEDRNSSTKLKIHTLEAFDSEGCSAKMTLWLEKKCSQSVKITLVMIKDVLAASVGLLLIPLQDAKDLVTILCLKIFHHDVIQGRIELIDNMPLEEFITTLGIIYGVQFFLKQTNSIATKFSSPGAESHSCHLDVFRCHFNPYWIPFVRETVIALQRIQEIIAIFRKKSMMDKTVEKLDTLENKGEKDKALSEILQIALDIEEGRMNLETLGEKKKGLKIISTVGDLLQGSILTILLLRRDLRTRSLLTVSSLSGHLGLNLAGMGTPGKTYQLYCLSLEKGNS